MLPQSQKRVRRNSSKVNLFISLAFHTLLGVAVLYFAAREGILGNKLRTMTVEYEKPKPPEKPPEKPKQEEPKVEPPKVAAKTEPPKEIAQTPPPQTTAVAAPPAVDMSGFSFNEGGRDVTALDPIGVYKNQIESAYFSKWPRPEDMQDSTFAAEVDIQVDRSGVLHDPVWKKGSGNTKWDDSVRKALANTKSMGHAPPTNFPSHFTVRFDVAAEQSELVQ
jgi:TonB C terminal